MQAVVQELRGETIDIVPFDTDEARFVCNALAPAEATRVLINEEEHRMQIVVPDEQLSLAIGRRGQNVRLASQLTGWKIDIQPESKALAEKEEAWISLSQIKSLSELQFQTLFNYSVRTVEGFINAEDATLLSMPGFENVDIARLKNEARDIVRLEAERKSINLERHQEEAKMLFVVADVVDKLGREGRIEEISLAAAHIAQADALTRAGYDDVVDIFLEHNLKHLANVAGVDEAQAKNLRAQAEKLLKAVDSRIKAAW